MLTAKPAALRLGLTDHERRLIDQRRRVRNCLTAIAILTAILGFIAAH